MILAILILCFQSGSIGGTLAPSDYHAIAILPPGHIHLNVYVAFDPARVPVIRWDGDTHETGELAIGVPIRVDYEADPFSPKGGGTAVRVILGPRPLPPREAENEAFAAAVEHWVAGTSISPRDGLDDETAEVVEALGSPSYESRERATGEMRGWPRERLAKALAWATGVQWPRRMAAEVRHRAYGIARARWVAAIEGLFAEDGR